jgi:hypothetical protein
MCLIFFFRLLLLLMLDGGEVGQQQLHIEGLGERLEFC